MDCLIITGMSGAGKSQAVDVLEDLGYYCVDNMPAQLIVTFISLFSFRNFIVKAVLLADAAYISFILFKTD